MSKVAGDVISHTFCLGGGGGSKMKILALGLNSTKLCIHNLWTSRELEMQKLTNQNGGIKK